MSEAKHRERHNTIRTFALVCVAITSLFVMGMRVWSTVILTDKGWCDRAIGASEEVGRVRSIEAIGACFNLLNQQVETLGWNSHVDAGVIALCLLALMVIVVAGGRISFTGGKAGVSGSLGPADAPSERAAGALETAAAAEERAEEIVEEEAPAATRPAPRKVEEQYE